jgi:hypothetical protein
MASRPSPRAPRDLSQDGPQVGWEAPVGERLLDRSRGRTGSPLRRVMTDNAFAYLGQAFTRQQLAPPAGLTLVLGRAPRRVREGDLCQVGRQENDALALIACLHTLASWPGSSAIERDRLLKTVTAVDAAPAR